MLSPVRGNFVSVIFGVALLFVANKIFPKIHFEKLIWVDVIFLVKYTIVALIMFAFVPMILLKSKMLSRSISQD